MNRPVAALVALATCMSLSACSLFDADSTLRLGVTVDSGPSGMPEDKAEDFADYYAKWLSEDKVDSDEVMTVDEQPVEADRRIEALHANEVDAVFGCTGELIDLLDPHKAEQLRGLYAEAEDPDPTEWRDISHSTMLSALPADLAASIPGEAEGCADDTLPQNLVTIYNKDVMSREQTHAVNNATAGMTFDDDAAQLP